MWIFRIFHAYPIVLDLNEFIGHFDLNQCGIGIIGVIDQLPDEFNAF